MSKSMTISYDDATENVFEELKRFFGVSSKAETIRRSLAITRAVIKYADETKGITITPPDGSEKIVLLLG